MGGPAVERGRSGGEVTVDVEGGEALGDPGGCGVAQGRALVVVGGFPVPGEADEVDRWHVDEEDLVDEHDRSRRPPAPPDPVAQSQIS